MTINCTLLVQIINFWLAYILIEKLLLAPVTKIKNEERVGITALETEYMLEKNKAEQAEEDKKKAWNTACKLLSQKMPSLPPAFSTKRTAVSGTLQPPPSLSKEAQQQEVLPLLTSLKKLLRKTE